MLMLLFQRRKHGKKNPIPVSQRGSQSEDSSLYISSVSCCPPCSDVEVVVRGGVGAAHISPPSGVTIILQTECHALETADKKINVTTASWWRRDRGGEGMEKKAQQGERRTKEEKQERGGASTAPAKTSPRNAASRITPLISLTVAGSCSSPPASHLFPFPNRLFQREGRGECRPWLQMCGPHNANPIFLAVERRREEEGAAAETRS